MYETPTCLLCGHSDRDVERTWARFREPNDEGQSYGVMDRCKDRTACYQRAKANGADWPVEDGVLAR